MKRKLPMCAVLGLLVALLAIPGLSFATTIYGDSAPNAFGSPGFVPWRDAAFQDASTGSMTNMRNGYYPGTTNFAATDALVYSTGDLGKRLHFIYFIPGVTKSQLATNVEVRMSYDWDGTTYYDFAVDDSWVTPNFANMVEINGGVAGTYGDAFWPADDDAPPFTTDLNPYNETDGADIAAVASQMYQYQTFWKGEIRTRDNPSGSWTETSLTLRLVDPSAAAVPTPAAFGGGAVLTLGLAMRRRKPAFV